MKTRPTVFVSAVSQELGGFRRAVEGVVRRRGCFADCQDSTFVPETTTVLEMLKRRLMEVDAVIHIVGHRYGTEPTDAAQQPVRRSYTQLEYDTAVELGVPIYRFLTRSPEVRDPHAGDEASEPEALKSLQQAYRHRIESSNHLFTLIDGTDDLCRHVGDIPLLGARGPMVDMSHLPMQSGDDLVGRQDEIRLLEEAWRNCRADLRPRAHLLSIAALGGEGKTALVTYWLASMAAAGWPGCEAVFAWSFYSQGTRDHVSSELFLQEALRFFGGTQSTDVVPGPYEKGRLLAQLIGDRCALVFLDGIEPLQHGTSSPLAGELKDTGLAALLSGLAARSRGLCVVTTRYPVADLRRFDGQSAQALTLRALDAEGGSALLKQFDVRGTQAELQDVVRDVGGHALSLALLGSYLREAYGGDVRQRHRVKLSAADESMRHGHSGRVMEAYLHWLGAEPLRPWWRRWTLPGRRQVPSGTSALCLLNIMGLFDRAVEMHCIDTLCRAPAISGLTEGAASPDSPEFGKTVQRLTDARLLAAHRDASGSLVEIDAHPLLREHMERRLSHNRPRAAQLGHRRLFEFFQLSATPAAEPTLRELEPLYRAIFHGCRAGLYRQAWKDVYLRRILRWPESYATRYLGAHGSDLGALANFFTQPWSRLAGGIDTHDQAWLFGLAGARLRAVSRLPEARTPMESGLQLHQTLQDWSNAGIAAGNLSELALVSGDIAAALGRGAEAVEMADRGTDPYMRIGLRTTLADACAQAGHSDDAVRHFTEAEALQAALQSETPLLYGLSGARYCEFLLSRAERVAWQSAYAMGDQPSTDSIAASAEGLRQTMWRALRLYEWRRDNDPPLEIALLQQVMGRAALLSAWLNRRPVARYRAQLDQAVSGLRRAGMLDYLASGLTARACMRHWHGLARGVSSAMADLEEAWEIAVRGPMPLHQADILLTRYRLFHRSQSYPWRSPADDFATAAALCETHHYGRRALEIVDMRRTVGLPVARVPKQESSQAAVIHSHVGELR